MPRRKAEEMSPAEWKVMTIVWRLKECAIGEVLVETKDDPGWARSTVKTLLRRLIDKGYINAKRVGSSFLYRPAQSPLQSFRRVVDTVLDNALEGTSGPILESRIVAGSARGSAFQPVLPIHPSVPSKRMPGWLPETFIVTPLAYL